ncbi:proline dehydrogenase family protein [Aquimarina brevivitae]|uniref:L-proline dehydrogenase n=1 Tax=Aquimarina brevivitae TaxID=323412 RepID=A0A4Q7P1U9_9FLAO|nr:proline dehydrogenase family protein [Aquimarina brevivitae]RZS93704.1 L-proline dehydrogenase [Aquimarina brevivitae]
MSKKNLFDNTEVAFALKSDAELDRAYFLFKMISIEPLVKIGTAMTNFALKAKLPVKSLIRATVFDHFCGGVSEADCSSVVNKMYTKRVCSVLDYSVEGKEEEEQFDEAMNRILEILDFVDQKEPIPYGVFKPTAFGRFALWQKKTEGKTLTKAEEEEWDRIEARFDRVCNKASDCNVALLIDSEESWMQGAADDLVANMMRKYNRDKAIIYNTLQLYRHDRLGYLKELHEDAKKHGYKIGMKIVRGAYMEKENERAQEHGYLSPICIDKQTTDDNFNTTLIYILNNIEDIDVFIGTHNEYSTLLAIETMEELGLEPYDPRIWFGQLYGMSDHISFNLAAAGYNVAKYLPFGPVRDVMPYLIRRAQENTSVAGQTSRELTLITRERKRRKLENES